MCGIAGVVRLRSGGAVDADLLHAMNYAQRHRGPDGSGIHQGPSVGLAHVRLSIIDRAGSAQPIYNEDGGVVVVYNGEIYNFVEIREELLSLGHKFTTTGDTEILVHGWEEWGPKLVQRLRGMFAFAIWDAREQTIFIARDRLGIKPLHYALIDDDELIFGSELKALLVHPRLSKELDERAIVDYLTFGYVPDPKCILKSVRKLEPGHYIHVTRDSRRPLLRQSAYWSFRIAPEPPVKNSIALEEELRGRLDEAVRIRMISEVPLGGFLSGGVDSSSVVASMALASRQPVNTCSIGFEDPNYDESRFARNVAEQYKTLHDERRVSSDGFALLDELAHTFDEPFADPSALPTYRLCELARRRVTVALSGDGADEMLAGYERYAFHVAEERVRNTMPSKLRKPMFGVLGRIYPKADWAPKVLRAKTTLRALAKDSAGAYCDTVSILDSDMRNRILTSRFARSLDYDPRESLERFSDQVRELDPLSAAQFWDVKTYLAGDILTKVDRTSMRHSLEVRVPFLDHEFVEWMSTLPPGLKVKRGEKKILLKSAMEGRLPREVLYRKKQGFSTPLDAWFRGGLRGNVKQIVGSARLLDLKIIDGDYANKLGQEHLSGVRNAGDVLWSLAVLDASLKSLC